MEKQIFICACKTGNKITSDRLEKWKNALHDNNIAYTYIEDLCGIAVKDPAKLQEFKKHDSSVLLGCQPRAMENILEKAGIRTCCTKIDYYNMETECTCMLSEIESKKGQSNTMEYDDEWVSWYPVLDYSRCTGCGKCLNFCLFGVYKMDDFGNVIVSNPSNCKDKCPACARTCPEQAIIFPKHNESPIDGGEGQMEVQNPQDVIEQIQKNEDVYKILADRRKKSGIPLLKKQEEIAEQERSCCASKDGNQKDEKNENESFGGSSGCSCGC